MTIYVSGGSNSVAREGWAPQFIAANPGSRNISIGGTASFVGIYRIATTPEIGPGDVVVWEYAVNDCRSVTSNGLAGLEKFEYFIQLVRDRGAAFAPLIFTPQRIEVLADRTPYFRGLLDLSAHYGLTPFDVSTELRSALGVATVPDEFYRDDKHYVLSDEMNAFLVEGATRAVAAARRPKPVKSRHVGARKLQLVNGFANDRFRNSILDIGAAYPPIRIQPKLAGEVSSVLFLSRRSDDRRITVRRIGDKGDETATVPLGNSHEKDNPFLKTRKPVREGGGPIRIGVGDTLLIDWETTGDLGSPDAYAPSGLIAGVLITTERPARLGRVSRILSKLRGRLRKWISGRKRGKHRGKRQAPPPSLPTGGSAP